MSKKEEPALVSVVLTAPHTHGRKDYAKGDTIQVTKSQRDWLIAHKKTDASAPEKKADAPAPAKEGAR